MALEKLTYKPIELLKDDKPWVWSIIVQIGKRKPALLCHQGKPIEFKTEKEAKEYIKEEYKYGN